MTDNDTRDPETIAREIRETQREMSRTVDSIGEQLTPRSLINALLDKAESNHVDARALLDGARRNPLALGLIAAGGIWLVSDSDARISSLTPGRGEKSPEAGNDIRHLDRGYVEHMSRVEHRADEDEPSYYRRRDHARASYLMIERGHGEDEASFRQRLDEATDALRHRREALTEQARDAGSRIRDRGADALGKARSTYDEHPLLGGIAAAFLGALAGAAIPPSRAETAQLGKLGAKAIDDVVSKTVEVGEQVREKKDELLEQGRQEAETGLA